MSARFRIRTSQGQEISFASHEMFAEFVRSGDLSPDDVVYDAETREWSTARTHPVVLQIELEAEEAGEDEVAEAGSAEEAELEEADEADEPVEVEEEAPAAAGPSSSDIGLDLAPAQESSPEEEAAAFMKKMEAERSGTLEPDEEPRFEGFTMEHGSSGLLSGMTPVQEEAPVAPPSPPEKERPKRQEPRRREPRREEREAPSRRVSKAEPKKPQKPQKAKKAKKAKKSGAGGKYAAVVVVLVVLAGAVVFVAPGLFGPTDEGGASAGQDSVVLPPPPPPLIPDTEDALRARAQERYLTTTRALLRDLPPIPDIWLRGAYLAAPSDYPQVRQVWDQYLTTVRQVREGDNERYRAAYTRALDDAQVAGTARTLRLASAVSDFQGAVAPRATHYDRVEALALAALQGHDALVQAEGTIAYEPAATTPVSGDPVIEAVGRNEEAQALLDEVLDVILAQLQAPGGPGRAANVHEWVWDGLLDAVTN